MIRYPFRSICEDRDEQLVAALLRLQLLEVLVHTRLLMPSPGPVVDFRSLQYHPKLKAKSPEHRPFRVLQSHYGVGTELVLVLAMESSIGNPYQRVQGSVFAVSNLIRTAHWNQAVTFRMTRFLDRPCSGPAPNPTFSL